MVKKKEKKGRKTPSKNEIFPHRITQFFYFDIIYN